MLTVGVASAVVAPLPEGDQLLSPSSLVARTCTWYEVPASRLPMLASVAVTFCGPLLQLPLAPSR